MKKLLIILITALPFMADAQAPVKDTTALIYNSKQTIRKRAPKKKDTMYLVKDSSGTTRRRVKKVK